MACIVGLFLRLSMRWRDDIGGRCDGGLKGEKRTGTLDDANKRERKEVEKTEYQDGRDANERECRRDREQKRVRV